MPSNPSRATKLLKLSQWARVYPDAAEPALLRRKLLADPAMDIPEHVWGRLERRYTPVGCYACGAPAAYNVQGQGSCQAHLAGMPENKLHVQRNNLRPWRKWPNYTGAPKVVSATISIRSAYRATHRTN